MKIRRILSILLMTCGLSGASIQPAAKDFPQGSASSSGSCEPSGIAFFLLSTYEPTSSLLAFYESSLGAFRGYPNLNSAIEMAYEGRVALMEKLGKPVGVYVDVFKFAQTDMFVMLRLLTIHKLGEGEGGFLETLKLDLYQLPLGEMFQSSVRWEEIECSCQPGKRENSFVAFQDALFVYSLEQQVEPEKISAGLRVFLKEDITSGVLYIVSMTRDGEVDEQRLLGSF